MASPGEIDLIARVVHEALRALSITTGDALAPWDRAEEWQRRTTLAGVKYRLENRQANAHALHERWAKEMRDQGWIYGGVKDAERKTHPSLVPYEELAPSEQLKDRLFLAIVSAFVS